MGDDTPQIIWKSKTMPKCYSEPDSAQAQVHAP